MSTKTSQLRKLQRQAGLMKRHIAEEEKFVATGHVNALGGSVFIAKTVCPFCQTENDQLQKSAEQLQLSIFKLSNNLKQAKPLRAKIESSLIGIKRDIETLSTEILGLTSQIAEIEKSEKILVENKNLYESVLQHKAKLDVLLDTLDSSNDLDIEIRLKNVTGSLLIVEKELKKYNYQDGLTKANHAVNVLMKKIGAKFEFEESYKPINLHFSFESFDLYHLTPKEEKIFLRSMGSGANWLYSHVTLFLALHQYFASLGERCAIPSILFLDQPTQVYFPSFKFDKAASFDKEQLRQLERREEGERQVDDDISAVENLFSQLSIYCTETEIESGFAPQVIVTDHADNLKLSDGTSFETLVNGNRWRNRGLINPVPN